jgi:hypothetical protein
MTGRVPMSRANSVSDALRQPHRLSVHALSDFAPLYEVTVRQREEAALPPAA